MPEPRELLDIDVHEVSIVNKAANRTRFLVFKAETTTTEKEKTPMTCPECGAEQKDGAQECAQCGAKLACGDGAKPPVKKADEPKPDEVNVLKADGTLDIDKLPENARAVAKALVEKAAKADAAEQTVTTLTGRVEKAEKLAADEREIRVAKEMVEKSAALPGIPGKPEDLAKVLRKCHDAGVLADVEPLLKAANDLVVQSNVLKAQGSDKPGAGTAEGELNEMARARVTKAATDGKTLSFGEAYAEVMNEQPGLYARYRTERGLK